MQGPGSPEEDDSICERRRYFRLTVVKSGLVKSIYVQSSFTRQFQGFTSLRWRKKQKKIYDLVSATSW